MVSWPLPVGCWKGRCRDGAGYLRTSLRSKLQEAFLVLLTPLALRLSISAVPLKTPPLDRPHQFHPRIRFMRIQILRPHHRTRDHRSWRWDLGKRVLPSCRVSITNRLIETKASFSVHSPVEYLMLAVRGTSMRPAAANSKHKDC